MHIEYGDMTSTLTIKKFDKEFQGDYRARIFSFMGEAVSIAELKMESETEEVPKFENEKVMKRTIKIVKKPKEEEVRIEEEREVFENLTEHSEKQKVCDQESQGQKSFI